MPVILYRFVLLVLFVLMVYLSIRNPPYNFSVWIPDTLLTRLGLSDHARLMLHTNEDKIAHIVFGYLISVLTVLSIPYCLSRGNKFDFCVLFCFFLVVFISAEYLQLLFQRNFSYPDTAAGMLGITIGLMSTIALRPAIVGHSKKTENIDY